VCLCSLLLHRPALAADELRIGATSFSEAGLHGVTAAASDLATHSFTIAENDLGEEEEVITAGAAADCQAARVQLQGIVDGLIAETIQHEPASSEASPGSGGATVAAAATTAPATKISPHVVVPQRGLVSIQQLVSELNHVELVSKLSKDRLTRVTQDNSAPLRRTLAEVSMITFEQPRTLRFCCIVP
jgi:hypothetical protein